MASAVALFLVNLAGVAAGSALAGLGLTGLAIIKGAALITGLSLLGAALTRNQSSALQLDYNQRISFQLLPIVARRIIYGRTQVAPSILSMNSVKTSDDEPRKTLTVLCAIADHGIDKITSVLLNQGNFLTATELEELNKGNKVRITGGAANDPLISDLRQTVYDAYQDTKSSNLPDTYPQYMLEIIAGTDASGDMAEKLDDAGFNVPEGFTSWDDAGVKGEGISWIAFQVQNHSTPQLVPIWNSIPALNIGVDRGASGLADPGFDIDGKDTADPVSISETIFSHKTMDITGDGSFVRIRDEDDPEPTFQFNNDTWKFEGILYFPPLSSLTITLSNTLGLTTPEQLADLNMMIGRNGVVWTDVRLRDGIYYGSPGSKNYTYSFDVPVDPMSLFPQAADSSIDDVEFYIYRSDVLSGQIPPPTTLTIKPAADNSAVAAHDYLDKYTTFGEEAFGAKRINRASVAKAARICDDRGWTCNGVLTAEDPPDAVLQQMILCLGSGDIYDAGGRVQLLAGGRIEPTHVIHEDDINEGWVLAPELDRNDRFSTSTVRFAEFANGTLNTTQQATTTVSNASAVSKWGESNADIRADFITDKDHANVVGRVSLIRMWHAFRMSLNVNTNGIPLRPNDVVRVQLPRLGIKDKAFRVVSHAINADLSVSIELIEETFEAWDGESAGSFTPPDNSNFGE